MRLTISKYLPSKPTLDDTLSHMNIFKTGMSVAVSEVQAGYKVALKAALKEIVEDHLMAPQDNQEVLAEVLLVLIREMK